MITASPTVYQVNISNNRSHTVHLNSTRPIQASCEPELGLFEVTCTCGYSEDHFLLYKHAIAVLQETNKDLTSYYQIVVQYLVNTYRNTFSFPIKVIRLKDFKDIWLYITDNEYESDDLFTKQIKLKAKAPKLVQLQGRPKKRRIRKITEERPNKK